MGDRDVTVDILANDKTGKGTRSAGDNFDKLNQRATKAVKGIESLPLGALGGKAGNDFVKGLLKPLAGLSGQAAPIFAAVGIGAAPLIGAAISGAIIGGAGIGGVAGGLIIASKDVRVQAAADTVGKRIESRLERAAGVFVEPAIKGVERLGAAVDTVDLEGIFRDASRYVEPLADGIGDAIESLGDGIEALVRNAGPAIDAISDGIGDFGEVVGDGLEQIATHGDSAADALRVTFGIINSSVGGTLKAVDVLTKLYEINRKIGGDTGLRLLLKATGQDLDNLGESGRRGGSGTFAAADGIEKVADEAEAAAPDLRTLAEKMDDAADAATDLFDSTTDLAGALDAASEAARENGKTLDANTEKGRDNRNALSSVARELRDNYDAYVAVNGAGAGATRVAEQNREAFIRTARQFGATSERAERLANDILGIPQSRGTKADFNANKAKRDISSYKGDIRSIPTYKRTVVEIARIVTGGTGSDSGLQSGIDKQNRTGARAFGGPTVAGGTYLVGERGPEILQMGNRAGNVIPNNALSGLSSGEVTLIVNLSEGVQQVVKAEIVTHDRNLKRRVTAGAR